MFCGLINGLGICLIFAITVVELFILPTYQFVKGSIISLMSDKRIQSLVSSKLPPTPSKQHILSDVGNDVNQYFIKVLTPSHSSL